MIRRHLIAWAVSGTSVIGTAGLTVVTVAAPLPHETEAAASPPVTVYDDRCIDDYIVAATATGETTTVPVADETVPSADAVVTGAPSAASGAIVATSQATTVGAVPPPTTARQPERTTDTPRTPSTPSTAAPSTTPPDSSPRTTTTARPTATTVPTTTVTTIPGTATTLPPGAEVPRNWPVGVPYPPIPSGCQQPHLEDNGTWNCEH